MWAAEVVAMAVVLKEASTEVEASVVEMVAEHRGVKQAERREVAARVEVE